MSLSLFFNDENIRIVIIKYSYISIKNTYIYAKKITKASFYINNL